MRVFKRDTICLQMFFFFLKTSKLTYAVCDFKCLNDRHVMKMKTLKEMFV